MDLQSQLNQSVITLAAAVIATLTTVLVVVISSLGNKAGAYLEVKLGSQRVTDLKAQALTIVRHLAQSPAFKDLVNEDKKAQALLQIQKYAEDHGISVSYNQLDMIVEEAVHILKTELLPEVFSEPLEAYSSSPVPVSEPQ